MCSRGIESVSDSRLLDTSIRTCWRVAAVKTTLFTKLDMDKERIEANDI